MGIYYRALNEITIKDCFPLPLPEEVIEKFQGKQFFSKPDFNAGYHQGWVASGDVEKTILVIPDSLWEWLIRLLGIFKAPA
jgi:hypothetical protein